MFIKNKAKLIKSDAKSKQLQAEVYKEIEEVIENFPNNLVFRDLLKFLAMPVLCFQYKYPTTERIRKSHVFKYLLEFFVCNLLFM